MEGLKALIEAFQRSGAGLFLKKCMHDQLPNLASLLAWGTLSTILPLLLGVLVIAGLVLRDPRTLDQVYSSIKAAMPSSAAEPITGVLDGMRQGAASAGIIAILLLLVTGTSFFANMASVFNQAYHVQGRNLILERFIGLGMLLICTALLVVSTLAASVTSFVRNVPGVLPIGPVLGNVVGWSISILSAIVLFLLIYKILPNANQTWRQVMPGALLATVLVGLISQLFPLYVALFPPNHAYALFGVFLLFTFYLYLLGIVLVLGAELNAFLAHPARSVALAEATAAAQHGNAEFAANSGESTGRSAAAATDGRDVKASDHSAAA
jgi:membrane protein